MVNIKYGIGNQEKNANLKPCPFCGSIDLDIGDNWCVGDAYVHCNSCGGHIEGKRELNAILKWNKRYE